MKQAQAALDKALKARAKHAKFVADMPTIAEYAELWVSGLRLEASTIHGYRKIIRNQVTPHLGTVPLDKVTATRLAAHYRELERCGRADGKGLSPNTVHKDHVLIGAMLSTAVQSRSTATMGGFISPSAAPVRSVIRSLAVTMTMPISGWTRRIRRARLMPSSPGRLRSTTIRSIDST